MLEHTFESNRESEVLFGIWAEALQLSPLNLEDSLASELAEYLGVSIKAVKTTWIGAVAKLKEEWQDAGPKTPQEVIAFYDGNETQLFESLHWHSGIGSAVIDNVRALQLAKKIKAKNYLDFGSGVGSNGILFARYGLEVSLADVSSVMLDFARFRFGKRNLEATFFDLKKDLLPSNYFDFVTAIHTLEHVPDVVGTFGELVRTLKPEGLMFVSTPFFWDEERPMHLVTDMSIAERFFEFDVSLLSESTEIVRIYRKGRHD